MKKIFLIIFCLTAILVRFSHAQTSIPDLDNDTKKLIVILNNNIFEGINNLLLYSLTSSFNNLYPETPKENITLAQNAAQQKLVEKQSRLVEQIIPIYTAKFTHDEIRDLLYFFNKPIGKKFIELNPEMIKVIQNTALEWGSEISQEVTESAIIHIPAVNNTK